MNKDIISPRIYDKLFSSAKDYAVSERNRNEENVENIKRKNALYRKNSPSFIFLNIVLGVISAAGLILFVAEPAYSKLLFDFVNGLCKTKLTIVSQNAVAGLYYIILGSGAAFFLYNLVIFIYSNVINSISLKMKTKSKEIDLFINDLPQFRANFANALSGNIFESVKINTNTSTLIDKYNILADKISKTSTVIRNILSIVLPFASYIAVLLISFKYQGALFGRGKPVEFVFVVMFCTLLLFAADYFFKNYCTILRSFTPVIIIAANILFAVLTIIFTYKYGKFVAIDLSKIMGAPGESAETFAYKYLITWNVLIVIFEALFATLMSVTSVNTNKLRVIAKNDSLKNAVFRLFPNLLFFVLTIAMPVAQALLYIVGQPSKTLYILFVALWSGIEWRFARRKTKTEMFHFAVVNLFFLIILLSYNMVFSENAAYVSSGFWSIAHIPICIGIMIFNRYNTVPSEKIN